MSRSPARSFLPLAVPFACACTLAACASQGPNLEHGRDAAAAASRPLPALEDAVRVWENGAERALAFDELLDRLAEFDVVFVGETHLDDTTHRVELAVLEGLAERKDGRVVLSLEMFERDVQPVLDDYLAGRIDERAFLAASRPWSNYASDYRPLIESAKARALPVVAANAPAAVRRRVTAGGSAALAALPPGERSWLPPEIYPADAAYWTRVDRATRGHMNFSSLPDDKRLYSGQNLWDNSMGAACAAALAAHPGATVVHVVGGFHVMYRDGTAAQLARRAPDARAAVVEVIPTPGLHGARPERDAERADFLVYADELARSLSDGTHAVNVPGELVYTLDVPPAATRPAPAPLVLWLPDGDERPEDARAWLRAALGDEVALAVLEPPYAERGDDLALGGRWASGADFRGGQARVQHALERIVEYATRRYPVSGERVLVAGRGSGATAVLWSAMYSEWLDARFLALHPRGAGALRGEGLPDSAPATRALRILVAPEAEEGARWLRDDYAGVGIPTELATADGGAETLERALRAELDLAPMKLAAASEPPVLCVLERDLPRARQWAEVYARRLPSEGGSGAGCGGRVVAASELTGSEDPARLRRLTLGEGGAFPLATFAEGRGLPLAPGDFGGTTVLVVPAGADAATREAWLALERDKAIQKKSPFAGLRVALADAEPAPARVLTELAESGVRSVLVVPAVFCASPEEMQALKASLGPAAAELDLAWLPGLGGELCCADGE